MSLMNRQTYNVLLAWHPGILDSNQVYHSSNNISSKAVPLHQLLPSFLFLLNISHPPITNLRLIIRSPSPLHTLRSYHLLPPPPIFLFLLLYSTSDTLSQKYRQHTLSALFRFLIPCSLAAKKKTPQHGSGTHAFDNPFRVATSWYLGKKERKSAYELYYISISHPAKPAAVAYPPGANKLISVPFKKKITKKRIPHHNTAGEFRDIQITVKSEFPTFRMLLGRLDGESRG
jgi:hypothetical protein